MKPTNQGCIYLLRNTVNGKCYVGQSIHNPPIERIHSHLYEKNNPLIAEDIRKHGRQSFEFKVLRENVLDADLDDFEVEEMVRHNAFLPHGYNRVNGVNRRLRDKHDPALIPQFVRSNSDWQYDKDRGCWVIYCPSREAWFALIQLTNKEGE